MTKVIYSGNNNYSVKSQVVYQINILPQKLDELEDVEISEVNGAVDNYVLVYDAAREKWVSQNPDVVLSAAATEPTQPGLPTDFVDEVNQDLATALDNLIDVDAGLFPGE